jgi:hypothetical protein
VTKNTAEWSEKLALSWSGRLGSNQLRGPWTWAKLEDIELPAGPVPVEKPMEARIARIESDVAHMRTDIADIKVDLRAVRDKLDSTAERLDAKIDAASARLDTKIERLDTKVDYVRDSLLRAQVWALLLYFALAGTLLGVMARGFGWI